MRLKELATPPTLVKLVLDDPEVVKEYGEPLEFWTWNKQPMDRFIQLASAEERDFKDVVKIVREIVYDEDGSLILDGDATLPSPILLKVIAKVVEMLGK